MRLAAQQRAAVEEIVRSGGSVSYSYRYNANHQFVIDAQPVVPKWLIECFGIDLFYSVESITFVKRDGGTLRGLDKINGLRRLVYFSESLDDRVLDDVASLGTLEQLYLSSPQITDKGCERLGALKRLKTVGLYKMRISDKALLQLSRLRRIRRVILDGTNVTEEGAHEFERRTGCEVLFRQEEAVLK
jgi:hypothetical protein